MKFSTLTTFLASAALTAYVNADESEEYYADYEADWETLAGRGLDISFQGCSSSLYFDDSEGDNNGDAELTRSRFVKLKVTDTEGNVGTIITDLDIFIEAKIRAIEEASENTCKYASEFNVMGGDDIEEWYQYCGAFGYKMEDAYGYSAWFESACGEDCQNEMNEMNENEAAEEEEQADGDQGNENEDNDGRRLRGLARFLNNERIPGTYTTRKEFCYYSPYDCNEDYGLMAALENFKKYGTECTETDVASTLTVDKETGDYVNYRTKAFCNPKTHDIKIGVFADKLCTYPVNIDLSTVLIAQGDEDEDGNQDATEINVDISFLDFTTTISCDSSNNDNNDNNDGLPSYLYVEDEDENNANRKLQEDYEYEPEEQEVEVSETCMEVGENSIGCLGSIFGKYSAEMHDGCQFVVELLKCDSSTSTSCGFSNIDAVGEAYLREESLTMYNWVINESGSNASPGQRALMFLMIPLTALFGVTSCFYHGKLASSGKNAALAGQGGAMA
jgi:hypothetical protein